MATATKMRVGYTTHPKRETCMEPNLYEPKRIYQVAKDNLDTAIAQLRQTGNPPDVVINWKPFMIDPGTKASGEEFEAYNRCVLLRGAVRDVFRVLMRTKTTGKSLKRTIGACSCVALC
jgi:hypothetical protein